MSSEVYRVAEFARLAGVTVRTLQYYDRIGLLKPSQSTEGGHRLYERRDLLRLQQILTLKWMGFKLDQIKELIESPQYDLRTALRMQKAAIDNQVTLPAFTRVDGGLFLTLSPAFRAQLNVENVLNDRYFAAAHSNSNITPGSPRAVTLGLSTRF